MSELISTNSLKHYGVHATDGELGSVSMVYLDDSNWVARYIVVDVGKGLPGMEILLPLSMVREARVGEREIGVSITREQVSSCPDMDADLPAALHRLARKKASGGWAIFPAADGVAPVPKDLPTPTIRKNHRTHATHLHSALLAGSLAVQAQGEVVGHVADFLVDGSTWEVRYLVVNLDNGKRVRLSPKHVGNISRDESFVSVDLPPDVVSSLSADEREVTRGADARIG